MWQQLINVSLLGTDRTTLDYETRIELERLLGFPLAEDPAEAVAQAAALLGFLRRTSLPLAIGDPAKKRIAPPKDDRIQMSTQLAKQFGRLLDGDFAPFLYEATAVLLKLQVAFPPEQLPPLLNRGLEDQALFYLLQQQLHPTDAWLASLNPRWHIFAPLLIESDQIPNPDTKLAALRLKRLQGQRWAGWKNEWSSWDTSEKLFYLQAFEPPLIKADSEILEAFLPDNRKEVRKKIASLLLLEKSSSLTIRWNTYLEDTLPLEKDTFRLTMPQHPPEEWKHLGLWSKKPIEQMKLFARYTDPAYWDTAYKKPLGTIVDTMYESKFGKAWLQGFFEAVIKGNHSTGAVALLKLHQREDLSFTSTKIKELVSVLSEDDYLGLVSAELRKYKHLIPEQSLLMDLLLYGKVSWPGGMVRKVLAPFQEWLATRKTYDWKGWHYRKVLRSAAYRIRPKELHLWEQGWPDYGYLWEQWKQEVRTFQRILQFRLEFYKDLNIYLE